MQSLHIISYPFSVLLSNVLSVLFPMDISAPTSWEEGLKPAKQPFFFLSFFAFPFSLSERGYLEQPLMVMGIAARSQGRNSVVDERHHTCVYIYIHTHTYLYMHMCVCMYIYMCVCVYIYIHLVHSFWLHWNQSRVKGLFVIWLNIWNESTWRAVAVRLSLLLHGSNSCDS